MSDIKSENTMKKVTREEGQSANIVAENVDRLKELFPEAFTEDGANFETLRQLLGDAGVLDEGEEKFGLSWTGKKKARQIALVPSVGTLIPDKKRSKNWDTTKNIFVEGDNLEVLKLLQKGYSGKVKLIYIDPPYNTDQDFIYPDKFSEGLETYLKYTKQKSDDGEWNVSISGREKSGRRHSNWLSMMYPRIKIAKALLSRDGFLFVSIDNNEVAHLKSICVEIFGVENFRNMIVVRRGVKNVQSQFDDISNLSSGHEYILIFSKSADTRLPKLSHEISETQQGKWDTFWRGTDRKTMRYELFGKKPETGQWRWAEDRTKTAIKNYEHYLESYSQKMSLDDYFLEHRQSTNVDLDFVRLNDDDVVQYYVPPRDYKLISDNWMDVSIKGNVIGFDTEKHINLINRIVGWITQQNDIVMDFFAGSGTTAQSVIEQNIKDGGSRRFILVQLPEPIKNGKYPSISDMTIDRIRQSEGMLSKVETSADFGYRVFMLSDSNIRLWNPASQDLETTLLSHQEHLVEGRSEQDILYELLIKRGIDLAASVENRHVVGKSIYSIGYGALFACLDESISREQVEDVAQAILDWHKELSPASETHVFFRDSAFRDDVSKTNMVAILEQNGISHVRSL